MNRKRIFIGICAALATGILLWWWLSFPKPTPTAEEPKQTGASPTAQIQSSLPAATPPPMEERRKAAIENILGALTTSITFYGKVIDQNGDPVPDANINYTALDKFDESGSQYQGKSDADGNFSISGIRGAALGVGVRKKDYYPILDKSNGSFAYGIGPDSRRRPPPTKDNPAIFVLHKMGETEPLIQVSSQTYRIQRNGTPISVSLETGRVNSQGDLQVEAWTEDQNKPAGFHRYNWRCRVSVPNGGLIERKGQFNFEAPTDGYKPSDEIAISAAEENWSPEGSGEYFIKLNDGRYARIKFQMFAGGDHFFKLESYLNPTPGSRNLEFDPAKVVKSP